MKNFVLPLLLICAICTLAGCPRPAGKPNPEQEKTIQRADSFSRAAQASRERVLKMSNSELLVQLIQDAHQQREPFNSQAFIELSRRNDLLPVEILTTIAAPDQTSLLGLLLMRKKDQASYQKIDVKIRTAILLDALKKSQNFNLWGLPHLYREAAAEALIECGEPALAELKPLLRDCRPIAFYGDEEVMEFKKYKYRFCDYILYFVKSIQKEPFTMPEKPEERDRLILEIQ